MKFACLIYHDVDWFDRASRAEHLALHDASMAYDEELARGGKLVLARALRPPAQTRTVRVRGKKAMVTDGPFTEAKEQLIGFIVVEATDMAEATRIAERIPLAGTGTVVIREAYDARAEGPKP